MPCFLARSLIYRDSRTILLSSATRMRKLFPVFLSRAAYTAAEFLACPFTYAFQSVEDQGSHCNMLFSPKRFVNQPI